MIHTYARKDKGMKRFIVPAVGCLLLATSSACVQSGRSNNNPTAVPKDINARFLAEDLNPEDWVNRFEVESREVFTSRKEIVDAIQLPVGACIADVGAGTGLFVEPFSEAVTGTGKVYAVDISPKLVEHMRNRAKEQGLDNVEVVLSKENSIELPAASVDFVFVCDTYHHFEFYTEMLLSIRDALRPGGQLIIIDFERIPGTSREWVLGHVRAGKDRFKSEIRQSGFRFIEEVKIAGFRENYFLRFERP